MGLLKGSGKTGGVGATFDGAWSQSGVSGVGPRWEWEREEGINLRKSCKINFGKEYMAYFVLLTFHSSEDKNLKHKCHLDLIMFLFCEGKISQEFDNSP